MRARIAVALVLSLLGSLAATSVASAGVSLQYEGQVENDSSTFFGFDIKKSGGKTRITHIAAGLAYTCRGQNGGGGVGFSSANRSLVVKNGKFHGTVPISFLSGRGGSPDGTFTISGSMPKNGLAKGTISSQLLPPNRGGSSCYTGGVDWRVTQQANRQR